MTEEQGSTEAAGTKVCPDCAEAVQEAARVCRRDRAGVRSPQARVGAAAVARAWDRAREAARRPHDPLQARVRAGALGNHRPCDVGRQPLWPQPSKFVQVPSDRLGIAELLEPRFCSARHFIDE